MKSRVVIAKLVADGWYEVNQVGGHVQFKHAENPGRVTVVHPCREHGLNRSGFLAHAAKREMDRAH